MSENKKILIIASIVIFVLLGGTLLSKKSSQNINQFPGDNFQTVGQEQSQTNSLASTASNSTPQQVSTFNFPAAAYAENLKKNASVYNSRGEKVKAEINIIQSGNGFSADVQRPQQFIPGNYSLIINQDGKNIEQDFTWGVLAINPNKSIYAPGETADLALAVLDEEGNMVCDASVVLDIQDPSGKTTRLSVESGKIVVNEECQQKKYTVRPDYEAKYQVGKSGSYKMTLTAMTQNGTYQIVDFFSVEDNADFDVERITATRIFPYDNYPISIIIKAKKDFSGQIIELAPASFVINYLRDVTPYNKIEEKDGMKYIIWDVSIKKGQTIKIGYNYKAPLISPYFYLLGPLNLVSGNSLVFQEKRAWQLAIDGVYSSEVLGTSGLISYWRLNEPSGLTAFDAFGTNPGAYSAVGITYGETGALTGDSDTAVLFDGTNSRISVPDSASLDLGDGPFSIEFWAKRTAISSLRFVMDKGDIGGTAYAVYATAGNTMRLATGGVGLLLVETSSTITNTNWHYFVFTKTGATRHAYLDGVVDENLGTNATLGNSTESLEIAQDTDGTNDFNGLLDEVAIYNAVLTPAEVLEHYNFGKNPPAGSFRFQGVKLQGVKIQ